MKNNLNIRLGFALALLTLACTAAAQGLSGQMTPTHSLYTREGDKVAIAVDFDLGKSKVRANDFYLVTPQLVSNVDANKVCQLPPFMVAGKTRAIVLERNERYGNQPEALNNLGVATALSGNREQARTLLEQAASLGSEEAKHNLSELGF